MRLELTQRPREGEPFKRRRRRRPCVSRPGSLASRSASASRYAATTVSARSTAGAPRSSVRSGCRAPSAIISPHEGTSLGGPSPRNESVASSVATAPSPSAHDDLRERRGEVRQQMPGEDARPRGAHRARREDEVLGREAQDLGANEARDARPLQERRADEHAERRAVTLNCAHDRDREDGGEAVERARRAVEPTAPRAARLARERAGEEAPDERDGDHREARPDGRARAVQEAREDVATALVRAEPMLGRRGGEGMQRGLTWVFIAPAARPRTRRRPRGRASADARARGARGAPRPRA